jgi:GT2 family glycosyltransferase
MSEIIKSNIFIKPKSRVFHIIPWNSDKNIGKSYNESMSLVNFEDWVCFLDGDAVHTSHFFGKRIEDVIESNPEYSLFTCTTNRVNCPYQIAPNVNIKSNDQEYHRLFGESIWEKYGKQVSEITNSMELSGVFIAIKKSIWEKVGGFKEDRMLSIDNDIHRRVKLLGEKVGLMKGIYVQHWYRGGQKDNKQHLL